MAVAGKDMFTEIYEGSAEKFQGFARAGTDCLGARFSSTRPCKANREMNLVGNGKGGDAINIVDLSKLYLEDTWQKFDHKKASR
jgi:hypothetical protein